MADAEQRRHRAHHLEIAGTVGAGAAGGVLAGERVRDAYARDKPAKLARVARNAGKVSPKLHTVVLAGRPPAGLIAAGTLAGGTAYAAQQYQEHSLHREAVLARQRAKRAKSEASMKRETKAARFEPGMLQKAYRAERHRKQGEALTAGGGVAAGGMALQSHRAAGKARAAASSARKARSGHAITAGFKLIGSAGTVHQGAEKYRTAAAAARTAHAPFAGAKPSPKAHAATKAKYAADEALHGRSVRHAGRVAGARAATGHAVASSALLGSSTTELRDVAMAHGKLRRATKAAEHHARQARSRGGVALGLLGTAAVLHESKKRTPPPRVRYY